VTERTVGTKLEFAEFSGFGIAGEGVRVLRRKLRGRETEDNGSQERQREAAMNSKPPHPKEASIFIQFAQGHELRNLPRFWGIAATIPSQSGHSTRRKLRRLQRICDERRTISWFL
jgi:hypothetical protein